MKNKTFYLFFSLLLSIQITTRADEGMWIPILLQQLNESEMQSMGMKLTAEDIYSINHSSMKDAIVLFGRGCTAEIISDKGLLLTNHHCGYGRIQAHSTLDHDYLTNGFWATNIEEELSNPGLTVTFLVRMEDVTEKVLQGISEELDPDKRQQQIQARIDELEKKAVEGTTYEAMIKAFYYGNEYYLFITEIFKDIRLVGAPPSSIGKFGGDTDNWMWPRHTGDFSIFRIYADKDNKAAEYSKDNKPYSPKYHFPISLKGYDKGDFTFVFGYPGTTEEYLPSFAIGMITEKENPIRIRLREKKLEIMAAEMEACDLVRIQYAAKYASIANYWKKMIGENRGIKRLDAINKKLTQEADFMTWVLADPERQATYGYLLADFQMLYADIIPLNMAFDYLMEAGSAVELITFARDFNRLVNISTSENVTAEAIKKMKEMMIKLTENHFRNYYLPIDKKIFIAMFNAYHQELNKKLQPEVLAIIDTKFDGNIEEYADYIFSRSIMASKEKVLDFIIKYKTSKYKLIEKDPAYQLAMGIFSYYFNFLQPKLNEYNSRLDELQRVYMKGLMEMQPEKRFYPDANSTLRITYGKVDDYEPRDAITYNYFTTLKGIMEKEDPEIYDYVVDEKLKTLYDNKDYGRYADTDGSMHVCFIASNHTTGGNSGSPLLNAKGQLIGINFDRNWEGTMSDLMYDPNQCRNISLDIRYCLFIIDKFAGARHLISEMTIIE